MKSPLRMRLQRSITAFLLEAAHGCRTRMSCRRRGRAILPFLLHCESLGTVVNGTVALSLLALLVPR